MKDGTGQAVPPAVLGRSSIILPPDSCFYNSWYNPAALQMVALVKVLAFPEVT